MFTICTQSNKKVCTFANKSHEILMKKILITGASGFIGSFIVEEALRLGMETWAAIRHTSSKKYLQDKRIRFIELDFSNEDRLMEQLKGHEFDYIVHAAGITKALKRDDFFRVNTDGTKNLVNAIISLGMPVKRFVYMSSLSIFGAIREQQPYTDIEPADTPRPNTAYGQSKLAAEKILETLSDASDGKPSEGFPYVILRPTGVYGPREKDYYLMMKSIKGHTDFAVGFNRQDITFVYVRDVVQAVFEALDHGVNGHAYFLSDGEVYQSTTFSNLVHEALGRPWWIRITAPLWLLRIITAVGDIIGHLTGKMIVLNNDKYNILKQRNWRCDISLAEKELGYKPQWNLERGVDETVRWYKDNGWL